MHYFLETKVVKHPLYSIGAKIMFRTVSVHFANLGHVKVAKHVLEPDALFRGTKVVKHPF
jgi:hypothetical protein